MRQRYRYILRVTLQKKDGRCDCQLQEPAGLAHIQQGSRHVLWRRWPPRRAAVVVMYRSASTVIVQVAALRSEWGPDKR